jgi:ornithine cyclodeaminase/alanine dehydrogenase-like protein (mu-crystallin family)
LLGGMEPMPKDDITVFKSLGLAVQDLAAAKMVLEIVLTSRSRMVH